MLGVEWHNLSPNSVSNSQGRFLKFSCVNTTWRQPLWSFKFKLILCNTYRRQGLLEFMDGVTSIKEHKFALIYRVVFRGRSAEKSAFASIDSDHHFSSLEVFCLGHDDFASDHTTSDKLTLAFVKFNNNITARPLGFLNFLGSGSCSL